MVDQVNPYNIAVGAGGRFTPLSIIGYTEAIGIDEGTVWDEGGLYSYLSSAQSLTVSSSRNADRANGSGARRVTVTGYDSDYQPIRETLETNGRQGVLTENQFLRVFQIDVNEAGSNQANVGTVYVGAGSLTNGVPDSVFASAKPDANNSQMCLWTSPGAKSAYVTSLFANTGAQKEVNVRFVFRPFGEVFRTGLNVKISGDGGPVYLPATIPFRIAEKTDIEVRATSSRGTADVSASVEFMVGL